MSEPDHMGELLRRAGAPRRSAQPAPPAGPSFMPPSRSRHAVRVWLPVAAGAAVLAVVATAVVLTWHPVARSAPVPVIGVPTATTVNVIDLVVHDGDVVAASGEVEIYPNAPVRFCAPAPSDLVGHPADYVPPPCTLGVTVTGVDVSRLAGVSTVAGVVIGQAYLRGVWHNGTIAVTEQGPPVEQTRQLPDFPLPCPEPSGGWKKPGSADRNDLQQYIEDHADQFRPIYITYPYGMASGETPLPIAEVVVVEVVTGDVEQARDELTHLYAGNLCVVSDPGAMSMADQQRLRDRARAILDPLMNDTSTGIYVVSFADVVSVAMVVLTDTVLDQLRPIGLNLLDLEPWLRPVRN